jgi:hypothetical protein
MQGQKDVDLKEEEFICVATFLPLKSWNYMIPFSADVTSNELKQVKETKGIMKYMLSRLIFKRSTFGRYPCGKIEVLYGTLLWHSPPCSCYREVH